MKKIWFKRILFSYIPISVEGLLFALAATVVILVSVWSVGLLSFLLSDTKILMLRAIVFLIVFVSAIVIAERHT